MRRDWRRDVGSLFRGTELIGIAAGESENPEEEGYSRARCVGMFWRILLFYVFAILIINLIIPYTDPNLLRNDVKTLASVRFTLVFQHAGLLSAAAIMNAVILTARYCLRVTPGCMPRPYALHRPVTVRPAYFAVNRGGVPRNALMPPP